MKERIMAISFVSAVSMILALTSGNASAEGSCRALDHDACVAASSCRWIKGYQRSDGRKVSAYCRKVPSKRLVKEVPRSRATQG